MFITRLYFQPQKLKILLFNESYEVKISNIE